MFGSTPSTGTNQQFPSFGSNMNPSSMMQQNTINPFGAYQNQNQPQNQYRPMNQQSASPGFMQQQQTGRPTCMQQQQTMNRQPSAGMSGSMPAPTANIMNSMGSMNSYGNSFQPVPVNAPQQNQMPSNQMPQNMYGMQPQNFNQMNPMNQYATPSNQQQMQYRMN